VPTRLRLSFPAAGESWRPGVGTHQAALFTVPTRFGQGEYSNANLDRLRGEMRVALKGDGLFADEAEALLNTWELSYFKSAGLRLFFLVPRRGLVGTCRYVSPCPAKSSG